MNDPLDYLAFTEVIYWGVAECLKNIDKTSKILEVGCGLGYLTYAMRKKGYNAFGLDISKEAIERNKQQLGNFYVCGNVYDYALNNKYDVIVLTELIEHINEPLSFIETLIGMLNPDGSIILTTPNKSFYPQNAIWLTDIPPVHGWWFSEESFKYIADKMDLDVSFVDFEPFYRNHKKEHYNVESLELVSSGFVFDEKGNLVPRIMERRNHGLIPLYFKSTKQYAELKNSSFYRYLNGIYAGIKNRQLEKKDVCSKHQTSIMCVSLKKK